MKYCYIVSILLLVLMTGCQNISINTNSQVHLPEQFDNNQALPIYNADLVVWWQEWRDSELTALINEGLQNSNSIKTAKQNIEMAKAYQTIVKADLWPMIGLFGKKFRLNSRADNPDLQEIGINDTDADVQLQQAGVLAKWNIDLFGQKQNEIKSTDYNLLSTQEMLHASQMALSTRIAENYFNAITIQYQIQINHAAIADLKSLLKYTQARFNAGQTTSNEMDKIQANISQLDSQKVLLEAQFYDIQQGIAVLVGRPPQGYRLKYNMQSLHYDPAIPTGIKPSDIIYRRPDLLARQNNIVALVAKAKAAKADLFPKFYINFGFLQGKISLNASKSSFSSPLFDIGVHVPIFTAGKIKANIKANETVLQKALYDYDHALLNALREVDTAYRWRVAYDKNKQQLSTTESILLKRAKDSQKLFQYGEANYDSSVFSHLEYLKAQEESIRQKFNSARATILLYQALGGGWSNSQLTPGM